MKTGTQIGPFLVKTCHFVRREAQERAFIWSDLITPGKASDSQIRHNFTA